MSTVLIVLKIVSLQVSINNAFKFKFAIISKLFRLQLLVLSTNYMIIIISSAASKPITSLASILNSTRETANYQ